MLMETYRKKRWNYSCSSLIAFRNKIFHNLCQTETTFTSNSPKSHQNPEQQKCINWRTSNFPKSVFNFAVYMFTLNSSLILFFIAVVLVYTVFQITFLATANVVHGLLFSHFLIRWNNTLLKFSCVYKWKKWQCFYREIIVLTANLGKMVEWYHISLLKFVFKFLSEPKKNKYAYFCSHLFI